MTTEADLAKLEISKNLLQMNFMRRTLIAKEKFAEPKAETFTPVVDIDFPLKSSIVKQLNKRYEIVSKWPEVHHLSCLRGTPFLGFRGSFGGFNHYFENLESERPIPTEPESASTKKVDNQSRKSNSKSQSKHKRKSHAENKGPPAKNARKNNSL
ncbi:unnamed protein product [Hymenolepis diminuta]|uniref:Uncharacterized protein n=1 Tax=Hymenolepis diminuta TaxID=6216 RepID=A0A564Y2Q6_HYMDI|nr:unnamed protein product [Hymenolepis diminuta]